MTFGFPHEKAQEYPRGGEQRTLLRLPADTIRPNPYQPRKQFDEQGLAELAESIREMGLIQPLVVRRGPRGDYELIAGERRLRACRMLGMKTVPCVLQAAVTELDSALLALIENVQRRDLHFFEEAECYRAVLNHTGMTQEQLAKRLGKSQSFLGNKLRLLSLSPMLRKKLLEARLTERHTRALLQLRDERMQLEAAQRIIERQLTVRDTERLVSHMNEKANEPPKPKRLRLVKDYRLFVNAIKAGAAQLSDTTGLIVELSQTDRPEGVDLVVRIRRAERDAG